MDFSQAFEDAVVRAQAGVVRVVAGRGAGSGTVLGDKGFVLTNAHVVDHGPLRLIASDQTDHAASLLAIDQRRDLALLAAPSLKAPTLSLAAQASLPPGHLLMAIGYPPGETAMARAGVVVGRPSGMGLPKNGGGLVLSDLRLAPGFSGGPMLDASGQVLAISTLILGGIAAGIPADTARRFLASAATEVFDVWNPHRNSDSRARRLASCIPSGRHRGRCDGGPNSDRRVAVECDRSGLGRSGHCRRVGARRR